MDAFPKDRDGALAQLQDMLRRRLAEIGLALRAANGETGFAAYVEIVNGEIAFIQAMLALIAKG